MTRPTDGKSLRAATFTLAGLASLALEVARTAHSDKPWIGWIGIGAALGIVMAAGAWLGRRPNGRWSAACATILAITLPAAPFVSEVFGRRFWSTGESPELIQMVALRNLMLAFTVATAWRGVLRLSCVLSLFLALGALMFTTNWAGYIVLTLYGVAGVWWLMGANWERLQGRFPSRTRSEFPLLVGAGSTATALVIAAIAVVAFGGASSAVALRGFFWASGGTGGADPFAARGIWDGDQLVAAKDRAASFGAVDSELFLDSEMPSFFDMFNDMYGEPINKKKNTERAIGLAPQLNGTKDQRTAECRQSGREFDTVRQPPARRPKELADRDSPALIQVNGRVPLHLRLETFDTFDGHVWSHGPRNDSAKSHFPLTRNNLDNQPWFDVRRPAELAAMCPPEQHVLKVIRLATNRIPTPVHPLGVHIDKVDQPDFYGWTHDDVLVMPVREQIPPLQVIHVRSRSLDAEKLPLGYRGHDADASFAVSSIANAGAVAALACEWTANAQPGYPQIKAILDRLRGGDFVVDSTSSVPAECDDAAAHFLLTSRRGPDFLFATSSVTLLRSLGYPARLASGLYATPERYDRLAQQTSVLKEDVHVWAEVCIDHDTWMTVEPTPGYEVLPPKRTWIETAGIIARTSAAWLGRHRWAVMTGVLLAVAAALFRRELLDAAYTLAWLACRWSSPRRRVLTTLWLLERRASLAGRRRPRYATPASWYLPLAGASPATVRHSLVELLTVTERLLYAPSERTLVTATTDDRLSRNCSVVVSYWTHQAMRSTARPKHSRLPL